jgi:hypothetical protein
MEDSEAMTNLSEFVVVSSAVLARARGFFLFLPHFWQASGEDRAPRTTIAQTCSAVGFEHNFEYDFSGRTKGWRKGRRVNRK